MLGPVFLDVEGLELNAGDRERIAHPQTGGVIYFARNYDNPAQLKALSASIRAVRPDILICADHEGGRVQRFRTGFTLVPPMRTLGQCFDADPLRALAAAEAVGIVIGTELIEHELDFTFAPVLDLDYGGSTVIGARALHADPSRAALLAVRLQQGFNAAGMGTVGKHFPGHGFVKADSHLEIPVDERAFTDIAGSCMVPYPAMIAAGMAGVMPAHVIYTQVDLQPAGFSRVWLGKLRNDLGFDGIIFSDDLTMEGASVAGGFTARAEAAFAAGCDMVLLCNDSVGAAQLLEGLAARPIPQNLAARQARMRARPEAVRAESWAARYRGAVALVESIAQDFA
jgi:beta-N-acetylhexosaminidase